MTYEELISLLKSAENFAQIDDAKNQIAEVIPAIRKEFDYDQNNRYHQFDLWEHSVRVVTALARGLSDDILYLAALLHDIGKPASRVESNDPDDSDSHYYGHADRGVWIVKNEVIPTIEWEGLHYFSESDRERLLFYIKHHDDYIDDREDMIRKKMKNDPERYIGLIRLEIADAAAHNDLPAILDKKRRCSKVLEICLMEEEHNR